MPAWVAEGYDDYARRMPREWAMKLTELKAEKRDTRRPAAQLLAVEATRIRAAWDKEPYRIVLDERGVHYDTARFARMLGAVRERAGRLCFVIGSADGVDPGLKEEADLLLTLSSFTLPHGLVRVILAEQLYRAVTLLQGHPYHRT
jgi:23S rRNA (pseudouridine1915-N3)-methyltransferase